MHKAFRLGTVAKSDLTFPESSTINRRDSFFTPFPHCLPGLNLLCKIFPKKKIVVTSAEAQKNSFCDIGDYANCP